jgi:hypothetical protein
VNSSLSFAKVWFIISFAGLAFLYGTAVGKWEWFPHSFLDRATDQARQVLKNQPQGLPFTGTPRYNRKGARALRPGKIQSGLTLISSWWEGPDGWKPGLRLINKKGQVFHKWQVNRTDLFQGGFAHKKDPSQASTHGALLLPEGDSVVNVSYIGMARLDACGNVLWTLKEGNHHSIARAGDGSFWTPGVSSKLRTRTPEFPGGFPGLEKPVWMSRILHVSEDGKILDRINVLDILHANDLHRYIPKGMGPRFEKIGTDPLHLNDVEPLDPHMAAEYPLFEAGDLLVSLRYPSLVLVLDPENREVKWYESRLFTHQHDPDFLGDGWIGVFDNRRDGTERGAMLGGTRIVALEPHADSMKVLFPTRHSAPHYTATAGKWQMLSNRNMILVEARAGRVAEVDSSGHTVWEWINAPISDTKMPPVTKAVRTSLSRKDVASWPCSSVDSVSTSAQKHQTAP